MQINSIGYNNSPKIQKSAPNFKSVCITKEGRQALPRLSDATLRLIKEAQSEFANFRHWSLKIGGPQWQQDCTLSIAHKVHPNEYAFTGKELQVPLALKGEDGKFYSNQKRLVDPISNMLRFIFRPVDNETVVANSYKKQIFSPMDMLNGAVEHFMFIKYETAKMASHIGKRLTTADGVKDDKNYILVKNAIETVREFERVSWMREGENLELKTRKDKIINDILVRN